MTENKFYLKLTLVAFLLLNMNPSTECIRFPEDRRPPVENDFKDGFYMIVGSERVNPNSKYVLSAISQNTKEPVNLELTLRRDDNKLNTHTATLDPSETKQFEFDIGEYGKENNLALDLKAALGSKNYSNTVRLIYNNKLVSTFIQTDKALYKPGEKVNIRVIQTNQHLIPVPDDNKINIFIIDPKRNRIKQWLNASLTDGVFTDSFKLNEEQTLGDYVIHVEASNEQKKSKKFEVNEYVLPQFDVKVIAPNYLTYDQGKFTATVDARYTHGKPINGLLKLTMRQRYYYPRYEARFWPEQKSIEKVVIEKPINGNVDVELNPVQQLSLVSNRDNEIELELIAFVTETLTNKNFSATSHVNLVEDNVKVEVVDTSEELKPGLPIELAIKIVNKNDEPITDTKNKIKLGYSFNIKDLENDKFIDQEYEVNNGLIQLKLDVPKNATDLFLRALYKERKYSIHQFQASQSKSGDFIQLGVLNKQNNRNSYKTGQKAEFEIRSTFPLSNYTLMVLKQNNIVSSKYNLKTPSSSEKLSIDVTHELAPSFKVAVFYLTNDNQIISDQKTIDVEDLFLTPIDLKASTNQTQPGENVDITVQTSPNAFVGVLGVDQSVLLLKTGNDITKKDILDDLKDYGSGRYNYGYYRGRSSNNFFGSTGIFSNNNLFCIMNGFNVNDNYYYPRYSTNNLRMRVSAMQTTAASFDRGVEESAEMAYDMPMMAAAPMSLKTAAFGGSKQRLQVRKEFPETWLFDGKRADEKDGKAVFSSKIPDTITSWIVSSFAVDRKTGLVVSDDKAKVTVFRPFFVKMNLPYSIVRGEVASIQVLVFNYMDTDQKVRVMLENDKDQFKFVTTDDQENDLETNPKMKEQLVDVTANNVSTVSFMISAKKAGNLILKVTAITLDDKAGDKVERILKVKSEGQTQYKNKALLINLDGKTNEQKFEIDFPENAIEGSKLINLNAIGDILGTSMANLDDLVRMPYGCGEQNMVNFVPNIIVLDYLTQAGKLTDKIKQKAIKHLESGYQRQLNYQRLDGSYSAFGEKDKEGSTWLTAFVLKSFVQAKKYIEIDDKVIKKAVDYLVARGNKTTGSFEEKGQLFSKALQGGVSKSQLPLSAYVLNALNIAKKNNVPVDFDLKSTENFLVPQAKSINLLVNDQDPDDPNQYNYYQLAIVSHVLHELDSPMKDEVYDKLWKLAQKEDNKLFFDKKEEKPKNDKDRLWYYIPNSNGVEASAYALLTSLKRDDTDSAIKILNWLVSKQNNNGGFASTQDTVIALEALAAIANKLYVKNTELNADFKFDGLESDNLKPKLKVDDSNALELQTYQISETNFEEEFKKINKVTMTATGKGNAVIQVGWQYNVASPDSGEYFNLTAKTTSGTLADGTKDLSEFTLSICASYKKKGSTNMAVIEVELPSGYIYKPEKIDELKKEKDEIKRIDMKNSGTLAVFYFDKLDATETCFDVQADRQTKVAKLKPALVKVYDYYKIEESGRTFYLPDQVDVCNICEDENCKEKCKAKKST